MISNCCGVSIPDYPDNDLCPDCLEHCEAVEEEHYNVQDGGNRLSDYVK